MDQFYSSFLTFCIFLPSIQRMDNEHKRMICKVNCCSRDFFLLHFDPSWLCIWAYKNNNEVVYNSLVHLIVISIGGGTSQKPFHVVATFLFLKFDIEGHNRNKSAFSILISNVFHFSIFYCALNFWYLLRNIEILFN